MVSYDNKHSDKLNRLYFKENVNPVNHFVDKLQIQLSVQSLSDRNQLFLTWNQTNLQSSKGV